MKKIQSLIRESIEVKEELLANEKILQSICDINQRLPQTFKGGYKVLFCGNGGSAADAQHIAAEFSGRFKLNRPALPAEALHTNSSALTAIANDFGYEQTYARIVESMGRENDVLIALSTSGNSKNIIEALKKAKEIGMYTIGMTGSAAAQMDDLCDTLIKVPSNNTPRVQECHLLLGHIICELVELKMFDPK